MPYIKQSDREQLDPILSKIVDSIQTNHDLYKQIDGFGMVISYLDVQFIFGDYSLIPVPPRDEFKGHIDELRDLIKDAGQLNYCITYILWSLINDDTKYALRAYASGVVSMIKSSLYEEIDNVTSQDTLRRFGLAIGVLTHVLEETYRRRTAEYEDRKIKENGDVHPKEIMNWENEGGNGSCRH